MKFPQIDILRISRPRFWLYLLGPFVLGISASGANFFHLSVQQIFTLIILFLFFTVPANFFIYGINDLFDYETDKKNPRKKIYESIAVPEIQQLLSYTLIFFTLPFVILFVFILPPSSFLALVLFLFFGGFYSAPPIRAKARPFLDSAFNILYAIPGLVGFYALVPHASIPFAIILGSLCWTMAMHAYSAILDIDVDSSEHIATIATRLGKNKTLLFCAFLWFLSSLCASFFLGYAVIVLGFGYVVLCALAYRAASQEQLFRLYTYFPFVNTVCGFVLFLLILFSR